MALFYPSPETPWRCVPRLVRRLARIAFYATSALVAVLSLTPSAALPPTPIGDKVEHAIAYAVLGLLGAASTERGATRVILGLAVFGVAIELLQAFAPGRSPELLDAVADIVGAGLGCAAAILLRNVTSLLIDKPAGGATPCRARVAGGDIRTGSPAAASSSSNKRASCESN